MLLRKGEVKRPTIAPGVTFRAWCESLAAAGMKVDGFPFTLDDRPAMHFIYDLIPSTIAEARGRTVVMMKCAQVGFTVMEMLAAIYMALKFTPCKVGMYLPDRTLAAAKSSERFMPVVRTIPEAYDKLIDRGEDGGDKGEGNVMIRNMADSRFHFMWTSGKVMTESFPMDVISYDEVQEIVPSDIEKTDERMSASRIKFKLMGSTANWPDSDIHYWYKRGTQHQFWTECPHCFASNVLDDYFPECIKFDQASDDYRYVCKECGGWIDDPQRGAWRAQHPESKITSVHFPQVLSPTVTPREIIESFFNADNMKNFYNRKLGKPYTDPSQVPINLEMLNACVEEGKRAGVVWQKSGKETYMGIDQMGAFNICIIKQRLSDGRQAVIHVEEIYNDDPFARCSELMDEYGVAVCCVETLPNYNDAKRFAQKHLGRVFLAGYADLKEDMMRWGDAVVTKADQKTDHAERDRYVVTLNQFKCMQTSFARIAKLQCLFPDPDGLTQEVLEKGHRKVIAVLKDHFFLHFTKTALISEKDEEQKLFKTKVVKVGIDPHGSFANMLCDIAWARSYGTSSFIIPKLPGESRGTPRAAVERVMHGLPDQVLQMLEPDGILDQTCGRCGNFEKVTNWCRERKFLTRATDPGCPFYVAKE